MTEETDLDLYHNIQCKNMLITKWLIFQDVSNLFCADLRQINRSQEKISVLRSDIKHFCERQRYSQI